VLAPPEGASNLQPVLCHAGVVSAPNWWTGEYLCGGDANALVEELEPLRLTALLLRVPEVQGCYISLHSARSACRLTEFASNLKLKVNELSRNSQRVCTVCGTPRPLSPDVGRHRS
jgi:hypothetical protein